MTHASLSRGLPGSVLGVLMLCVFTVSMGFGLTLPILPFLVERLIGVGGDAAQVSRVVGLLTGLYTLSLFLFAPVWGKMSDLLGRRLILLIGLIGFSATMLTSAFFQNLTAIYAERFLSGMFAAAVTPVASATVGDLALTEQSRGRGLTFVSLAGISGFLLGPMTGVFVAKSAGRLLPFAEAFGSLAVPLIGTALLAALAATGIAIILTGTHRPKASTVRISTDMSTRWLVPKLLALAFIVSAGVGVFEVGLALRGKQELGLTQTQIALMFTECSAVMIVVQAIVFSPWIKSESTRWLLSPALAILAVGLFLVPRATSFNMMLTVIAAVAASAGILSPILTYWISAKAGKAQGAELGWQTAAASLGATVGSVAGGLLFDLPDLPGAAFLLMAALTGLGLLLAAGLPKLLVTHQTTETTGINKTSLHGLYLNSPEPDSFTNGISPTNRSRT